MSKNVAFTICAKNYIGLAQILEKSIKKNNPELDFFIIVADEFTLEDEGLLKENGDIINQSILTAKEILDYSSEAWTELSFKYNLTEFCTAIKPKCFSYFFASKKYEKVIFFDPDIMIFNSLKSIYDDLENYSMILTPHLIDIETSANGMSDNGMISTGVFNLGFLALKNNDSSKKMLDWWNFRLLERCYIDFNKGYFTDQKWMNFLPGYFDNKDVLVTHDLGMNVAPWNFCERKLSKKENFYYITERNNESSLFKLIFTHYSGFDYKALINNEIVHTSINDLVIHPDLQPLFDEYGKMLNESLFLQYLKMKYTYSAFNDGSPILHVHRRLYRRLLEDDKISSNPYSVQKQSFYTQLKENNLILDVKESSNKSNRYTTPNIKGKIKIINFLLKLTFRMIGSQRYFQLVKLLSEYSRIENHLFLIDKSYNSKNIYPDLD